MGVLSRLMHLFLRPPQSTTAAASEDGVRQLRLLESAVAAALAEERKVRLRIRELRFKSAEWERYMVVAVHQHREDLARDAIDKRAACDREAKTLLPIWQKQRAMSEDLREKLRAAKNRVGAATYDHLTSLPGDQAPKATMFGCDGRTRPRLTADLGDQVLRLDVESDVILGVAPRKGVAPQPARLANEPEALEIADTIKIAKAG